MAYCIWANPITVDVGEGNEFWQAIWKKGMLKFSRTDADKTHRGLTHVSADTLGKLMYALYVFLISSYTCWPSQRYNLGFLSASVRNESSPASSKNLHKYIQKFCNSASPSLRFRVQMLFWNYITCAVQCFPQLKAEFKPQMHSTSTSSEWRIFLWTAFLLLQKGP